MNELTKIDIKEIEKKIEEAVQRTQELLASSVFSLLKSHAFLGHLVQMLNRQVSLEIPTACVCAINNRYHLLVNPFFFSELNSNEAVAIVKHELYHLLNDHLQRAKNKNPMFWNIGADMAINCYIENLPSFNREELKKKIAEENGIPEDEVEKQLPPADKNGKCCTCLLPEQYGLERCKSAEYYYDRVTKDKELQKKMQKQFGKGGKGEKQVTFNPKTGELTSNLTPEELEQLKKDIKEGKVKFDFGNGSHEKWETVNGQTSQILDEELKRMIREAKDKAPQAFGNLPSEFKENILKFLSTKLNWKSEFRKWVQHATQVLRKNTRKRPSRRFGITYEGQKSDYKLNLGVGVDSSGSIYDKDLQVFGGEINRIFNTKMASVEYFVGDTEIHEVQKMKRKLKPKDFKVSGRGGTCAKSWLRFAEKQGYDAVVILTDGYFDFNLKKPPMPVLWVLTKNGYDVADFKKQVKFGNVIKMKHEGDEE